MSRYLARSVGRSPRLVTTSSTHATSGFAVRPTTKCWRAPSPTFVAVVAGDTDFANTLRFPPGSHTGIVVLRLPNEWDPVTRATRAVQAIAEALQSEIAGVLIVVDPARIRVLRPPRSR